MPTSMRSLRPPPPPAAPQPRNHVSRRRYVHARRTGFPVALLAAAGLATYITMHATAGAPGEQPPTSPPPGTVRQWISQADQALIAAGTPAAQLNDADTWLIIQHESNGDPNRVNLWDSNAQAGHPSKGLMQTIDSTFRAYALPGYGYIYNPVDNIIAGVRYALARYGSLDNVPGVRAVHAGHGYSGY